MSLCACVCVCVCVCEYVYMYVSECVFQWVNMCVFLSMWVSELEYECVCEGEVCWKSVNMFNEEYLELYGKVEVVVRNCLLRWSGHQSLFSLDILTFLCSDRSIFPLVPSCSLVQQDMLLISNEFHASVNFWYFIYTKLKWNKKIIQFKYKLVHCDILRNYYKQNSALHYMHDAVYSVDPSGPVVIILYSGSEVRRFKPRQGWWIFSERKNPEYDFLRKGSNAVGPVS